MTQDQGKAKAMGAGPGDPSFPSHLDGQNQDEGDNSPSEVSPSSESEGKSAPDEIDEIENREWRESRNMSSRTGGLSVSGTFCASFRFTSKRRG